MPEILLKAGFLAMLPAALGKSLRATSPCLQVSICVQNPEKVVPKSTFIAEIALLSCTHKGISQGWRTVIRTSKVCRVTVQRAFSTTHACRDGTDYTKVILACQVMSACFHHESSGTQGQNSVMLYGALQSMAGYLKLNNRMLKKCLAYLR